MCSIIKLQGKRGEISLKLLPSIKDFLDIKGGDEYNAIITNSKGLLTYVTNEQLDSTTTFLFARSLDDILTQCIGDFEEPMEMLLFSRLTPEMEISSGINNLPQPYYNYFSSNKTIVAVHGTIPNAEAIAEKYNFKINVDTEIFFHLPFWKAVEETELTGGKICAISLGDDEYHNGLGLFKFLFGKVKVTTNLDFGAEEFKWPINNHLLISDKQVLPMGQPKDQKEVRIISLFSGGLDITCSTQEVIRSIKKSIKSIDLWYFDWGTVARDGEVQAGKDFTDFLNDKLFPDPEEDYYTDYVTHTVLPVKKAFKNILGICGLQGTRLTDEVATGAGSHEAESAISYVPYRNTILLTLAAARAEQLYPGENCIFVIGANLSEGMIYLDNSEPFVTAMNTLVKLGGQKSMYFEVQAPYVNRTKTAMIKDAKHKNFRLDAFSCYFPIDGKECGTCGSCLLKQNALLRG